MPKLSEQANKTEKPKLKRKVIESDDTEAEDLGQPPVPELYIAPIPETGTKDSEEGENIPEQPQIKNETNCSVNYEERQPISQEKEEIQKPPIKGPVNWKKARSSQRVPKKPDRWGHNIMVTKTEAMSSAEGESLPSVYEIQKPNAK